jgi:hypothetical protein
MKPAFAISGIVVFSCAAMLGVLLTALVPFSLESWWLWPVIRLLWQVVGGLWCGLGIALLIDGGHAKLTLGVGAFGLILALNPVLDLVQGPAEGELLSSGASRYTSRGRPGSGSIRGSLLLETDAGDEVLIEPIGAQANRMETQTQACPNGGRVYALRHLDVVLEVVCAE